LIEEIVLEPEDDFIFAGAGVDIRVPLRELRTLHGKVDLRSADRVIG
jgi:hypothetical protein